MRILCRLGFPLTALLIMGVAAPVRGRAAETGSDSDYVLIETPAGGVPMLVVRYPWARHEKPSVEVRTYLPGEEDSARVLPLYFRHVFMKGMVTVGVYKTQAAAAATQTIAEFTERGIDFKAIGQRSLLGRPAVCVTCQTDPFGAKPTVKPASDSESLPSTKLPPKSAADVSRKVRWAIFPFAEAWEADERTLFLSLPESNFAAPAKIRVFFLRNDDVVWSETEQWPGLASGTAAPTPAASEAPATAP